MPSSFRRPALALLAALALASTLLVGSSAEAAAPAPVVGDCHDYTFDDMLGEHETSTPVDCSQDHNARVIEVFDLPDGKDWSDYSLEGLGHLTTRHCYDSLWDALGRSAKVRDMTAYTYSWFTPTKAQRQDGARWIRCDLVLLGGKKLMKLPTDAVPALPDGSLTKDIKRCMTGHGYDTVCTRDHAYRAMGAFTMKVDKYPSDAKKRRLAIRHCGKFVTSRTFSWTTAGEDGFRQGDHVMVCYNKTKH